MDKTERVDLIDVETYNKYIQDKYKEKRTKEGPWTTEPSRVEFEHQGYPCLAVRNEVLFNWCGYVGLKPDHPMYGMNYDKVNVNVHGGLTYSDYCRERICHKTTDNDKLYWFGFDCAHHAMDYIPGGLMESLDSMQGTYSYRVYRDIRYVKHQIELLAEQLKTLEGA